MDLQHYIRETLTGKRIILVGNAPFKKNRSQFVDGHEVVIRFNLFETEWFRQGLSGRKIDYWCVNLGTGRRGRTGKKRRDELDRHSDLVQRLNTCITLMTPHEEDSHRWLADAKGYYPSRGLELIYPDTQLKTGLRKQPSTGYYVAFRLLAEGIAFAAIGFTGEVSDKHDGKEEIRRLRSEPLVDLQYDF